MTKTRPISFSAPMAAAIREGRKTQTRRTINPQPDPQAYVEIKLAPDGVIYDYNRAERNTIVPCPYGQPGDRLWVREDYYAFGYWTPNGKTDSGRQKWKFVDLTLNAGKSYRYADSPELATEPIIPDAGRHRTQKGWRKRRGRFMPRHASRMTLEVTSVRVERLQDISQDDAIAEGIAVAGKTWFSGNLVYKNYEASDGALAGFPEPRDSFRSLWLTINGAESWAANPHVWVVGFRRIDNTLLEVLK